MRVMYANEGRLQGVTAKQVIMACYNRIIPHLVPALPEAQKQALSQCIKRPMMIINVLVRNGRNTGLRHDGRLSARPPGAEYAPGVEPECPGYRSGFNPDKPAVVQFYGGGCRAQSGRPQHCQQHQVARAMLLEMPFEAL